MTGNRDAKQRAQQGAHFGLHRRDGCPLYAQLGRQHRLGTCRLLVRPLLSARIVLGEGDEFEPGGCPVGCHLHTTDMRR